MTVLLDVALVASAVVLVLALLALADEALIRHTTRSNR